MKTHSVVALAATSCSFLMSLGAIAEDAPRIQPAAFLSRHSEHFGHTHHHGPNCGHRAIQHGDHVDYLHEGHYHHLHSNHWDECAGPEKPKAQPVKR